MSQPLMIVARQDFPAVDLRAPIEWLKANPDKATQGAPGPAAIPQLAGLMFQGSTETKFRFVTYRGGGLASQDLVGGQLDMMIGLAANALPQVLAGSIKANAVTAKSRMPSAPAVTTVDEAGLPGFHVAIWQALYAPKGTPADIVRKLRAAVAETLADPAVARRLGELGQDMLPTHERNPETLAALQRAGIEKWWPVARAAQSKGDP